MSGVVIGILTVGILSVPASVKAQSNRQAGVERLTKESYDAALECGQSGESCAVKPYLLCPAPDSPFAAYIATPFSRVATAISDATKAGKPARAPSFTEANYWGFGVYVFPAN